MQRKTAGTCSFLWVRYCHRWFIFFIFSYKQKGLSYKWNNNKKRTHTQNLQDILDVVFKGHFVSCIFIFDLHMLSVLYVIFVKSLVLCQILPQSYCFSEINQSQKKRRKNSKEAGLQNVCPQQAKHLYSRRLNSTSIQDYDEPDLWILIRILLQCIIGIHTMHYGYSYNAVGINAMWPLPWLINTCTCSLHAYVSCKQLVKE